MIESSGQQEIDPDATLRGLCFDICTFGRWNESLVLHVGKVVSFAIAQVFLPST
jgi:hypothetical protein